MSQATTRGAYDAGNTGVLERTPRQQEMVADASEASRGIGELGAPPAANTHRVRSYEDDVREERRSLCVGVLAGAGAAAGAIELTQAMNPLEGACLAYGACAITTGVTAGACQAAQQRCFRGEPGAG
jgi:hypothetical protein